MPPLRKRKRIHPAGPRRPSPTKLTLNAPLLPKPALGLDYDDASDSDDSRNSSPGSAKEEVALTPPDALEEDLGDVEARMKAKRAKEEDEEEELSGLVRKKDNIATPVSKPKHEPGISIKLDMKGLDQMNDVPSKPVTRPGTPIKDDMTKRMRVNLGFKRRLSPSMGGPDKG